jgi:hypothetical protein
LKTGKKTENAVVKYLGVRDTPRHVRAHLADHPSLRDRWGKYAQLSYVRGQSAHGHAGSCASRASYLSVGFLATPIRFDRSTRFVLAFEHQPTKNKPILRSDIKEPTRR